MDDEERMNWIRNNEDLYRWFKSHRMGLYRFVRENREEIDKALVRMGVDVSPQRMKKRAKGYVGRAGQDLRRI